MGYSISMLRLILLLCLWFQIPAVPAEEDWAFPGDDLQARIAEVSEGELTLLDTPPEKPVHHHQNRIHITPDSLQDGWVMLEQCHRNLDPVAESQILYHSERIRNIRVLSTHDIDTARVEGPSVQLGGIGRKAVLCLGAESRALTSLPKHRYRLKNGPYMRRFLDGYYPMRVSLEIHYPAEMLELQAHRPEPGKAGKLEQHPGHIRWDGWFTGRLFTEFDFIRSHHP
jgi:hypothetical protein